MDRRIKIGFVALLMVALARYIAVAFFVHPFADDFSYAVAGMHNDLFKRLADEYQFWNGRWFSNILVLRGPLVLGMEKGLWLYRLVPIVLLALTWCGAFALIRSVAPALERMKTAIAASLFLLLYLHLMPDLSEGIYWYTGAVSYQLPGALILFLLASWARGGSIVFNLVLATIICGCTELHMVFMVLLHAALPFFRWRATRRIDRRVLFVFAVVLIAAAVMILAPGNAGRGSQFPHKHEFAHTMLWGAMQTGRFLLTWILSPATIIISLLYLSISDRIVLPSFGLRPWTAIAVLVVPVFIAMALPYWATGLLGQHRTVNATLLLFLPWWFVVLATINAHWLRKAGPRMPMAPRTTAIACALLTIVFFVSGSGGRVSVDLIDSRLHAFDAELCVRYQWIEDENAEGSQAVTFPAMKNLPRCLRYLDGDHDPEQWINRSIAQYFGADSMRITIGQAPLQVTAPVAPR